MDFVIVGVVAFLASGLTLYSGFGLGTVLLPAFALFFQVATAVAATAVVHLLNNVFKGALLVRQADWGTVRRFGLPAIPAAAAGAWLLSQLGTTARVFEWTFNGRHFGPTAAGITIGSLMVAFALLEMQPWFQRLGAPPRWMPVGGVLSGFVGGLTGQQGAFRSMFLLKTGLPAVRFVATGVLIAILVDLSRIPIYAVSLARAGVFLNARDILLVLVATVSAAAGAYLGVRVLRTATTEAVRLVVAGGLVLVGVAMMAGVVG